MKILKARNKMEQIGGDYETVIADLSEDPVVRIPFGKKDSGESLEIRVENGVVYLTSNGTTAPMTGPGDDGNELYVVLVEG